MKGKDTCEISGGHIEYGENWQIAIERELFEEAGVVKTKLSQFVFTKFLSMLFYVSQRFLK